MKPKTLNYTVNRIPLDQLEMPKHAMRTTMDANELDSLASSMKTIGLQNPILVKKKGKKWEVVAGHRRSLAANRLHWKTIPAFVLNAEEKLADIHTVHENLVRENVSATDEARYLGDLMKRHRLSQRNLARTINRSEQYVSEKLAVLQYPQALKEAVEKNEITFTAARELARIKNEHTRDIYVEHAIRGGINDNTARQWRVDANSATPSLNATSVKGDGAKINIPLAPIKLPCFSCDKNLPLAETITVRVCTTCADAIQEANKKVK